MDYKKLYYNLCNYCRQTSVEVRIKNRNGFDERLSDDFIYTELHHIIPKHSNGNNSQLNLVEMLPEEHLMAHLIRYKAYNNRNDFLAVRFMVNGYTGRTIISEKIPKLTLNKMVRLFKSNMSEFRKRHGWHTIDGRKRISDARTGKLPIIKNNGDIVSVSVNHPKVISGEWKHHTYGTLSVYDIDGNKTRITTTEYQSNKNKYTPNVGDVSGEKNPTYSGFTDSDIVDYVIKVSNLIDVGYIIPYSTVRNFCEKYYNISLPKSLSKFRFNGHQTKGLIEATKSKTSLKYDTYLFNKQELRNKINNKIKKLIDD